MSDSTATSVERADKHASLDESDSTSEASQEELAAVNAARPRQRTSPSSPHRFSWIGWTGVGLLVTQGVAMLIWSTLLWRRFALTWDYSIYHQAWWLIAQGHLDPFDTVQGISFWQNHFELMLWPLALLGLVSPHGPVLLYIQDVALVGAELVAWRWIHGATTTRPGWAGRVLAIAGLVLLLGDPWSWWAISFDFHMEIVGLPFIILAAYELGHQGRRRTWLWVGLALLCGTVVATYVVGLGIAALLAGRRWRRQGVLLLGLGVVWTLLTTLIHANRGIGLVAAYGYLGAKGLSPGTSIFVLAGRILEHPTRILAALWDRRVNIWANLAPGGFLGIVSPWVLGLAIPVLLANELAHGGGLSAPLFQSALLYVFLPVGTVLVLVRCHQRWPRIALSLAALAVVDVVAWAIVWGPQLAPTWLEVVPAASAAELTRADAMIPPTAEVVASQGFLGRFSDRAYAYEVPAPRQRIPVRARQIWWIIGPAIGVEPDPVVDQAALVATLAGSMHAQLELRGAGIWVFRWVPRPRARYVTLPAPPQKLPAWAFVGASGVPVLAGPPNTWYLGSSASPGYVFDTDYWREPPGRYDASVTLAASVPVNVEVWNATGDVMLARESLPPSNGPETVHVLFDALRSYPHQQFTGWGPLRADFTSPPTGDRLEVKVWSPGGGIVDVEGVQLIRVR